MEGEDGRPLEEIREAAREAGINVDIAMDEFMITSSLESAQKQRRHDDQVSDIDAFSSDHDGSCSDSGDDSDGDDNGGNIGTGEDDDRTEEGARLMSPLTREDDFMHATQDQDHGSRTVDTLLSYSHCKIQSEGST